MSPAELALVAIQILLQRPRGTQGGVSREHGAVLIGHLLTLISKGKAGAQQLKAWAEEIHQMASEGRQPVQADFERWTSRLDTALDKITKAKEKLESEPTEPTEPTEPPEPTEPENPADGQ